jgi:hypothetical protein
VVSLLLAVGYRPRLVAFFLYLTAVSTFRWNFPVVYVDDSIMHVVLFWMILLPTGRTLTLTGWRARGSAALRSWRHATVPGAAVRCLLVNVSLIYVVAGLWKWTSPKWRDGSALHTALQMPISRAPDFWQPELAPLLAGATFATLVLEPLLPLMFVLPTGHRLKWALLVVAVGFHLGIALTMKIPYANLALLAALVLAFRNEIACALAAGVPRRASPRRSKPRLGWSGGVAVAFVLLLTFALAGEAAVAPWRSASRLEETHGAAATTPVPADGRRGFLKTGHNPFYAPLWFIGVAQSYRLFDWVDDRNWDIRHEVEVEVGDGSRRPENAEKLFPRSTHSILLQSYMHGVTWGRVPPEHAAEFRASLIARFTSRYCRNERTRGTIHVYVRIRRIVDPTKLRRPPPRKHFVTFVCEGGSSELIAVSRP